MQTARIMIRNAVTQDALYDQNSYASIVYYDLESSNNDHFNVIVAKNFDYPISMIKLFLKKKRPRLTPPFNPLP